MKIIITAAGLGNRFLEMGINKPKYKIIANKKPLFYWSIYSLKNFFNNEFIFIFRKEIYDEKFIKEWLKTMGINKYNIILIDELTDGQATTAMFADKFINENESVMIYNIDTSIIPESMNINMISHDGTIVVAKAPGEHWSFAKLGKDGFVCEVSEKIKISDYASIGPYYFAKWFDFKWVWNNFREDIKHRYKEVYVCPMYQYLINKNKKISIFEIGINDYTCLGTPHEIEIFDRDWLKTNV